MGRGKCLLCTVIAAVSLSTCTHKKPKPPEKAPIVETIKKDLTAKWKNGTCTLDSRTMELTYTGEKGSRTMKLDTEMLTDIDFKPKEMMCSSDYTIILGEEHAIIAIGGDKVIGDFHMLGSIDGEFSVSNSYYIGINKIKQENIESVFVADSTLVFVTGKHVWEIDLVNPQNVYKTKRTDSSTTDV